MDIQQLITYEATLQFAMGDVLRDLAILMHYCEQGQAPDNTTTQTLQHLKIFQDRLGALEQQIRTVREPVRVRDNAIGEGIISSLQKGS